MYFFQQLFFLQNNVSKIIQQQCTPFHIGVTSVDGAAVKAMDNIYATDDKTTDGWDDDDLDLIDEWEIDDAPDDGCATATGTANEESSSSYPPSSIQGYFQYLKTGEHTNDAIDNSPFNEAAKCYISNCVVIGHILLSISDSDL